MRRRLTRGSPGRGVPVGHDPRGHAVLSVDRVAAARQDHVNTRLLSRLGNNLRRHDELTEKAYAGRDLNDDRLGEHEQPTDAGALDAQPHRRSGLAPVTDARFAPSLCKRAGCTKTTLEPKARLCAEELRRWRLIGRGSIGLMIRPGMTLHLTSLGSVNPS